MIAFSAMVINRGTRPADVATYVSHVIRDVPQGIFCFKLKDGMGKMMPQAISGATVQQP